MDTTTDTKIDATSITLHRAEGYAYECRNPRTFTGPGMWDAAQRELAMMALTAPADGSYHKVDAAVDYEDGETFSFRIDLTNEYPAPVGQHLAHHAQGLVLAAATGVEIDAGRYENFAARYATS